VVERVSGRFVGSLRYASTARISGRYALENNTTSLMRRAINIVRTSLLHFVVERGYEVGSGIGRNRDEGIGPTAVYFLPRSTGRSSRDTVWRT
jgi:hypothetical protein